jgi:hypothetical protein
MGNSSDLIEMQRERAANNQSIFREVNERIGQLLPSASFVEFVCECLDRECAETVSLTRDEYEHVRSKSNSFLVLPGHDVLAVEEVIESHDRYLIVAKLGAGRDMAERLDPRRRSSPAEH